MANSDVLISIAMLTSIWEKKQKDNLDLLIPFVKYVVGRTTDVGAEIDENKVIKKLNSDFGLKDKYNLLDTIINKIFKRLVKAKILKKDNKKYILTKDISDECDKIDVQREQFRTQTDIIINSLREFLNNAQTNLIKKDLSLDEAKNIFIAFLEEKGYFAYIDDAKKLENLSLDENSISFLVGKFILNKYLNDSNLFSKITNIITGLMIARIIYIHPEMDYNSKIHDFDAYLDSRFLLAVFGFKTKEENENAKNIARLLKDNGITLKCFQQNYKEVCSIVESYRSTMLIPEKRRQTLEYFDDSHYDFSRVSLILIQLEDKSYFKKYEISVVETPSYNDKETRIIEENDYKYLTIENDFKDSLQKRIKYRSLEALENDVKSISSIYRYRLGKPIYSIEKCKVIFITTNDKLANLSFENFYKNGMNNIPLAISDIDIATLLWIKNYNIIPAKELSMLSLVENAVISIQPTELIREEFFKKVEQMQNDEIPVSSEQLNAYRLLIFNEKEKEKIMDLIEGNSANVNNLKHEDLERMAKEYYGGEINKKNILLEQQSEAKDSQLKVKDSLLEKKDRQLKEAEKRLEDIKEKEKQQRNKRYRELQKRIKKSKKLFSITLTIISYIIYIALIILGIVFYLKDFCDSHGDFLKSISFQSGFLILFGIIGIIDAVFGRKQGINNVIKRLTNKWGLFKEKRENKKKY